MYSSTSFLGVDGYWGLVVFRLYAAPYCILFFRKLYASCIISSSIIFAVSKKKKLTLIEEREKRVLMS